MADEKDEKQGEKPSLGDVVEEAKEAAEKVTADGKVTADELIEAGVEAAEDLGLIKKREDGKKGYPPLLHHLITELRRFLVPVVTTLAGLIMGGAGGFTAGTADKEAAVQQAVQSQEQATQAVQDAIQKAIERKIGDASWGDVQRVMHTLEPEDVLLGIDPSALGGIEEQQVQQIAAEQLRFAKASARVGDPVAMPFNPDDAAQPAGD